MILVAGPLKILTSLVWPYAIKVSGLYSMEMEFGLRSLSTNILKIYLLMFGSTNNPSRLRVPLICGTVLSDLSPGLLYAWGGRLAMERILKLALIV